MNNRKYGSNKYGLSFSPLTIQVVWQKASPIKGWDPNEWRLDACGAVIHRNSYGSTVPGKFGWEIDHIVPVARNGSDELSNLQPLQWQNNRRKSDNVKLECAVYYSF